jgi:hypothetical protein
MKFNTRNVMICWTSSQCYFNDYVFEDNFNVSKILRYPLRLNCEFEIWIQNDVWEMPWDWIVNLRYDYKMMIEKCFEIELWSWDVIMK